MFDKILIANRGEIALRVIRACRELGIRTVAVFSDVDRDTPAVWEADEARPIGPAPALESYLNIDRILEAAVESGADAIHPGYGFLAENARFARRCSGSGIVFIGPPPEAMERMGDKAEARRTMQAAGVPVIPGTEEGIRDDAEAEAAARSVGFPLLLKPVAGGGGKGMRVVRAMEELRDAFRFSRSEAKKAFGDDRIYLERYLEGPRHIEIQILADDAGNVVHLGERECSIQRRHQKLIEEAPSPVGTPELRERLGGWACRAARSVGYTGAGTVEFLMDREGEVFFLEMNTRLQVEHPVTEMVTGIDLVREQIRVAAGEPLGFGEDEITFRGAAIECRISSEDPENDFLPSSGVIRGFEPPGGPWVRVDSGVAAGNEITLFYDPMFAKVIVWAEDRGRAIDRMIRALEEFRVVGVRTTIPFHRRILEDDRFRRGEYDTRFLEEESRDVTEDGGPPDPGLAVAALLAHLKAGKGHGHLSTPADRDRPGRDPWRDGARGGAVGRFERWRRLRKERG
jgi:acetyl-CoA carboxylase biotin carboxylase subunit